MCLFCKNDAKQIRGQECFITYECASCGKYIVPTSQIGRIKKSEITIELNKYRNTSIDSNAVLFIGTTESYNVYKNILLEKYNAQTESVFVDIEGLL